MGPPPSIGHRSGRDQPWCQSAKGYPSSGGFSGSSHFQIFLAARQQQPLMPCARKASIVTSL